jgi:hypothetical protein
VAWGSAISPKLSCQAPAALCGWQVGDLWKAEIPPMLAAQSAFPSGPMASFQQKFSLLNLEMNQNQRSK